MSNVKHKKCTMRDMAQAAKARLMLNSYKDEPPVPKNATPQQREIYVKLYEKRISGESANVDNPIEAFADKKKLQTLSHDERQRYIMQLCSDYVSMRSALDATVVS